MTKRLQITIKGNNVQRCGFRKAAVEMAKTLKLSGTAMYIDHDILIEVEGDTDRLKQFVNWAQTGPAECDISDVETKELPVSGDTTFNIIHGIVFRKKSA